MLLQKEPRLLFKIYTELFRIPGALRIALAGFISRMPIAMDSIAIIYFVHSVEKNYSIAGAITGVAALTTVVSAPLWAKAADKFGQRKILYTAVPIRISAFILFIYLVENNAPKWTWFTAVIMAEFASISVGSMTRRRWVHLVGHEKKDLLSTSYALESLIDEFVFILGPVITTLAVTVVDPKAGILLGITFLLIGIPIIAQHKFSDPGVTNFLAGTNPRSVLFNRKLQAISLPITLAGGSFSAINICVVAFSDEQGAKSMSGILLGLWAAGGAISALINGAIRWKISHGSRYLFYLLGMTTISLAFPFIDSLWVLALALFLQGMCIAPLLPNGLPLITNSVSPNQLTQAITLATAGIPLTGALSSFFSGKIIDSFGASVGLWLPFGFLFAACLVTVPYLKQYRD